MTIATMLSLGETALKLGLICSLTVLALFLSYSMLNVCDLSTDGCFTLGAAVGAAVAGRIIQNREAVHPGTYIGKGKIEEVKGLLYALNANGVICDDELSPAQMNNLERELECKVMDRTLLILDIFAKRAVTSEGKIQVELAQLRYRSARLVGLRSSL